MNDSPEIVWTPGPALGRLSQMQNFAGWLSQKVSQNFSDYRSLHQWSVDHGDQFWPLLAEHLKFPWIDAPDYFCQDRNTSMRKLSFFKGGSLNFAQALLNHPDDKVAVVSLSETQLEGESYSFGELRTMTAQLAAYMRTQGVQKGDRVAGVVSNDIHAVASILAAASLGAVWSSCSPDFGTQAIVDRFEQIQAKVLIMTGQYNYGGKEFPTLDKIPQLLRHLTDLKSVILCSCDPALAAPYTDSDSGVAIVSWAEVMQQDATEQLVFTPVAFDDPLYILYSSGTTGKPKAIVHAAGRTLLQHLKELRLHCDVGPHDRMFYYTTCGWMMWNWMVSALATGASIVCYDGRVHFEDRKSLWDLVADHKVSIFGTSPKYIQSCKNLGVGIPAQKLPYLQRVLSTGSPLLDEHFDWFYKEQKMNIPLSSIAGGTDLISCFILGHPDLPVRRGQIQCIGLGMAVESWDEQQNTCWDRKGELVCSKAFISMPIYFWNDPDGLKYAKSYFEQYPGQDIWHHGDFIEIKSNGGIVIHGRSDATLNPGGIRMGTAEFYRVTERFKGIEDALVIGQNFDDDVRILLFVKVDQDITWGVEHEQKLRTMIRTELSPRHLPAKIIAVEEIPYTHSGKKVELSVTKLFKGEEVNNISAIANPECLNAYRHLYQKHGKE